MKQYPFCKSGAVEGVGMRIALALILSCILSGAAMAGEKGTGFIKPGDKDKCAVCGMFVHKYPDWVAEVLFPDGTKVVFDGPKDLFKYLLDPEKYGSARSRDAMKTIFVTDYYQVRPVDAYKAFYVFESDVYGPMGKELVPFEREADARSFLKDHRGTRILRFRDIVPDVVKGLD
jgi:copper chaperone NosL